MNKHDREIIDRLEGMPFTEARKGIKNGTLLTVTSLDHQVALSWLEGKEAELRDEREVSTLSIAKEANRIASDVFAFTKCAVLKDRIIAIAAIIIAMIAARDDIIWFISWVISKIRTL